MRATDLLAAFGPDVTYALWPVVNREMGEDEMRERFERADKRYRECSHPPSYEDMAMHVADGLLGTFGVVGCATSIHSGVSYCNAGDAYATTLVLDEDDEFHVGCWADFAPDEEE